MKEWLAERLAWVCIIGSARSVRGYCGKQQDCVVSWGSVVGGDGKAWLDLGRGGMVRSAQS